VRAPLAPSYPVRLGAAAVADDALHSIVRGAVATVRGARLEQGGRVSRVIPGRRQGVGWRVDGGAIRVEVDVAAAYGEPLPALARGVQRAISDALTAMTGLDVRAVDVTVAAVDRPREAARP